MQMAERLLFGNKFNVITLRICDQLANLCRRKRAARGPNQRIRFARERVLHIKGVQVELEAGFSANLPLDVVDGRNGATADVVQDRAPAHRGPVDYFHTGNESASAFAAHELLECLQAIESSGGRASRNHHFIRTNEQDIALVIQCRWSFHSVSSQCLGYRWKLEAADDDRAARLSLSNRQREIRRRFQIIYEILRGKTIFDWFCIGPNDSRIAANFKSAVDCINL